VDFFSKEEDIERGLKKRKINLNQINANTEKIITGIYDNNTWKYHSILEYRGVQTDSSNTQSEKPKLLIIIKFLI